MKNIRVEQITPGLLWLSMFDIQWVRPGGDATSIQMKNGLLARFARRVNVKMSDLRLRYLAVDTGYSALQVFGVKVPAPTRKPILG